jgi:HSP20 family molecular chaperone IbpA
MEGKRKEEIEVHTNKLELIIKATKEKRGRLGS